ncbi:MAG: PQQ-binding-like beta-propeller repeat protein [Candidatus Dojkabacteria bacterium]|nr:PQQ-binding-like beta-propeller repeat protein [Candidatus Dojkabacteria bacterium]
MGGTSNGSDRTNGVFEAVNRNSGETVWSETFSGQAATDSFITLGNNGSLYISGIENDILAAYDIDEKISTKWIYQFNGGHSNVQVAIADDGTLYTTRNDTSTNARIIAFNPDGSIKWTTAINPPGTGGTLTESHVGLASDGTVYVDSYRSTGQSTGTLYALDPEDGSITWTYPEIPSRNLLVDEEDTVYLADSYLNPSAPSTPVARRVVAVNSDGSLKWERTFDPTVMSYERIALSPEGVLVGYRAGYFSTTAYLDFFDIEDGSTVRTISIPDQGAYAGSGYLLVDSQGGIFATAVLPGQFSDLHYFDAEGNERWKLHRTFSGGALEPMIRPALDEDGRLYLSMLNYYTTYDSRILAFYPWTLTVSTDKEAVKAGETITFTAVTVMPQASPLTGDVNKMQLYLEGGQTVFFMYSGVNEDGDTEWTADFTVPEEMEYGEHSYTVEAGAAGIQTDIELHFTSPASGTNNTGYTVSDTFMVGSDAPVIVLNPLTSEPLDTALPVVSGTAIALNGTVSSVEFQVDSMTGAWQICDADDGDFDEVTEEFTCAVTSSLSNGSHTIFVRAGDSNGHVTQSGEEESATFSVAAEESGDEEVEVQEAGLSVSGEGIAWVAGGSLVVAGSYMAKRRGLFSNLVKKYKNTN